jgi:hypothetical protein
MDTLIAKMMKDHGLEVKFSLRNKNHSSLIHKDYPPNY